MRFSIVYHFLRQLLLVILCFSSLWLVTPCLGNSDGYNELLCLGGKQSRIRRQNENFSTRALAETAQTRAYLSPVVFLGTLRSVLVQRDGTVRSWFAINNQLKTKNGVFNTLRKKEDTEVVYYRNGDGVCLLEVNQDNLKLGAQYLVFGTPLKNSWPSLAATALPIPNDKRTLRAVKRVVCKGCAKAPSIAGLQKKVKVEEGSKIRLHCHLSGNPIPWVEWYKEGKKITTRGRLRVRTKRRTSKLVIRRTRQSDRGVYECRAGNAVQKEIVSAKASVIVTRKKKTTKLPPSTSPSPFTFTSTESSPWTTEPCPSSDFCLNGGTCIFYKDVREYVCQCAEGYIGLRCHYKDVRVSLGEVKNYSSRGAIP